MSPATTFHVGDIWKPEDTITDPKTKAKVDPATVTATATKPDLTAVSPAPTVTKLEVGVYVCSINLTEAGRWQVHFSSTGTYQGAKPEAITVYPA